MNLSAHKELKAYRDELARSIGGGRMAALERANGTARRIYAAGVRHADARKPGKGVTDKDITKAMRAVVAEVRRTVGVTEVGAPKAKPGKGKSAAVSEAVKAAVGRVVAEAMAGKPGPGSGSAEAGAPDNRPLTELTDDDLPDRLSEAMLRTGQPQRVAETVQPEPPRSAMHDVDLSGDPGALQGLSDSDFMDFLGAAFVADGEQRLGSPLFGNARAGSPFMQGL